VRVRSNSPDETQEIGQRIGRCLKTGDVVCLYGDLGMGKTTLVRGVASAFGIEGRDITSASFSIIAEYPTAVPFYHVDLYRISTPADLESTGIWEVVGADGVVVVEWAERLGDISGIKTISVQMESDGPDVRTIEIEGLDEKTWNNM